MVTHVELYEALKPTVGEAAARLMAEVIPPARDLATKADLAELRQDFAAFRGEMLAEFAAFRGEMLAEFAAFRGETREEFAEVRAEMHAGDLRTIKWVVGAFVPMFAATWGMLVAVIVKL